ncbi:MAG: AMP-binding protein [Mycobacterium sp.]|nr:AMP-binding protein [Mycobacterium sp.]
MSIFSPDVRQHVDFHAPALRTEAVDYRTLLEHGLPQIDFYDSRRHIGALTGAALAERVLGRAGALTARGLARGDRVVMVADNTEEYLATVLAVLLLGAVPCAVAPPPAPSRPESAGVQHLRAAVAVIAPAVVLAPDRSAAAHPAAVRYEDLEGIAPLSIPVLPVPTPSDTHHLQLTSGSTSAPKAVVLTHGNVAHNIATVSHAMATVRNTGRLFSWLPMYHDMGFIQVLGALIYGGRIGLMTPLGFLRDPLSWMRNMTHHRSTVTAGPTFAYRAAADALARGGNPPSDIDLSELRHAYVGAEPIAAATLRGFAESFAPCGLWSDALLPSYGMAESVLATAIASHPAPEGPGNFGRVRTMQADGMNTPLVSCGPPIDGMCVRLVDPDGAQLGEGVVGDIQISGPSVMAGYLASDGSVLGPPGGWHDTGDRGLICSGELFVVGRSKEMLIVRGRNMPPYDVERSIGELAQVGPGQAVVFSTPDDGRGRESLVAVVATGSTAADQRGQIRAQVAARVRETFGFSLDDIVLVPKTSIPRTTSGKIQRLKARDRYLAGQLPSLN